MVEEQGPAGAKKVQLAFSNSVASSYQSQPGPKLLKRPRVRPKSNKELLSLLEGGEQQVQRQLEKAQQPVKKPATQYQIALEKARLKCKQQVSLIELEEKRLNQIIEAHRAKETKQPSAGGLAPQQIRKFTDQSIEGIPYQLIRGLPTPGFITSQQARKKSTSLCEARFGTDSIVQTALPSERVQRLMNQLGQEDKEEDQSRSVGEEQLQRMREELGFMREDGDGVGLGSLLQRLQRQGGAAKQDDQKQKDSAEQRIKLQYRDNKGRLMGPKQAFRYMCYMFHGQGPGHRKLEKRKLKEARAERGRTGQNPAMVALRAHQQVTGQPHMPFKK